MRPAPLIAALALVAASASAAVPSRTLRLEPKIDTKQPLPAIALATALSGKPFTLAVADARGAADPEVVGAQKEGSATVYEWRSAGPVGPAVEAMLRALLRPAAASGPGDGPDAVTVELSKLEIVEVSQTFGSSYQAAVATHVTVLHRGAQVWSGNVSGTARKSGPDERPGICNEVLTLALAHALAEVPVPFPAEAEMAPPAADAAAAAVAAPPAAPREPPPPPGRTPPDKLFADLERLKAAGLSDATLISYVREHAPSAPLSAEDVLRWKAAGFSETVIQAALAAR